MLTFTGHAGFKYETDNSIILMDPWMSRYGAFDQSWYQFPPNHEFGDNIKELIETTDKEVFIYISHEHKDHFDIPYLETLAQEKITYLTPNFRRDHVVHKLKELKPKEVVALNDGSSDSNVIIGFDAGIGGDAAMANCVVIGRDAMRTTGNNAQDGTVAIGKDALANMTTGSGNTAIGYQAGDAMTDCNNNTLLGYQALSAADSGEAGNICIGYGAGDLINDSGADNNVIIGNQAARGGTAAVASCVVIGVGAMGSTAANAQTGTVAIGREALAALTSGNNNTALGYQALLQETTGNQNIAIGNGAMDDTGAVSYTHLTLPTNREV